MNEKTCALLEFDAVRKDVAGLALSEEAGRFILEEEPLRSSLEAGKLKMLVSAVQDRIAFLEGENPEALPELAPVIKKLEVEGLVLEIEEVYALWVYITRAEAFRQWLLKPFCEERSRQENPLAAIAGEIPSCADIAGAAFKVIDKDGKLRDLPEFREIKKRIKSLQRDIESVGSRYAGNEEKRRMLQSDIPSQRDGRLVLAVKSNFRGRIRGIIHEVSSSGQTIFVEPEEVVEKNNQLLIENRRLEAEIRRVMRELTAVIAQRRGDLEAFHKAISFLETIRARARYGFERKGVFAAEPDGSGGKLVLKKARHPLLGRRAVPLDLVMGEGIRTVIITGPNTGGKTVALKTLGLLAMMNQFGLALPVDEGSVLPVFDGIYADIGDEQSISQSLSTFSGHMTNIADIIKQAADNSLVLLDELGSGTDPEEGSAIAMAILDHFIEKKIHVIVTTHHGILKNYGYTREGVENASMEFDGKTLSPTFKIVMGIPGESRALDIASRNGFPLDLVGRARSYLDDERSDVSALISGLKEKHKELDAVVEAGKKEEQRLIEERRQSDLKELRLKQKELQLKSGGIWSLKELLGESRKTMENLVRELREGNVTREKTLKVKEFLSGLEDRIKDEEALLNGESLALAAELRSAEHNLASGGENVKGCGITLEPGMEVLVHHAGTAGASYRRGRLIRMDRKDAGKGPAMWVVEIGSLKMSLSEHEIFPVKNAGSPAKDSASWTADLSPSFPLKQELNLLGMRLPEALENLNRQIETAILGGLGEFAVVHGKGDGILCKGVQDFLKNDPRVENYFFSRPELGGFGRTEVVLK